MRSLVVTSPTPSSSTAAFASSRMARPRFCASLARCSSSVASSDSSAVRAPSAIEPLRSAGTLAVSRRPSTCSSSTGWPVRPAIQAAWSQTLRA